MMVSGQERHVELQRDFLVSAAALVLVNLLLAFGAIGLFIRMGPVIDDILEKNVVSLEAAQEMLAVLTRAAGAPVEEEQRLRFEQALDRATTNVTEPEEAPVVIQIGRTRERALEGDREALNQVVNQLDALVRINHQAMREVDAEARRLGNAGAWSAVFLAFFSFLLSIGVVSRLRRRVIAPIVEIYVVLEAVRRGDLHRRCRVTEGSTEIQRLSASINFLLDGGLAESQTETPSSPVEAARTALVSLLEERPASTVLVDVEGNIVAVNGSALEALNGPQGADLRKAIAQLPGEDRSERPGGGGAADDAPFDAVALPGETGWLLTIR